MSPKNANRESYRVVFCGLNKILRVWPKLMTPVNTPRLAIGTIDGETDPWPFLRIFLQ